MTALLISFAIFMAAAIGLAVLVYFVLVALFMKHTSRDEREQIRQAIARAERSHKRRKQLRKDYVESVRRELAQS